MTGRVRYWNPAAEILFGWPPLAMVGRTLAHLSPPADAGGGWRQLLQEGRWQGIVQRRSPAGAYVGAAVRQHVRYHDDGTPRDIVEYGQGRSEEHTSELQALMRISYAVICLTKHNKHTP